MGSLLSVLSQSPPQDNEWTHLQKDLEHAMNHRTYLRKYPLVAGFKAFGGIFFLVSFAYIIYFGSVVGEQLRLEQIAQEDLLVSIALGSFLLAPFLGLLSVWLFMSFGATVSHWDRYFQLLKKWNTNIDLRQEYDKKRLDFEKFEEIQVHVMHELKGLSNNELEQHLHNPLVQPWALKMIKEEWINRSHTV